MLQLGQRKNQRCAKMKLLDCGFVLGNLLDCVARNCSEASGNQLRELHKQLSTGPLHCPLTNHAYNRLHDLAS